MRPIRVILPALLVLGLAPSARGDTARWFDAKQGCGPIGAFAKSGRASDLPGCTGRLPKDAPQVEVALHDAKEKLVDAEELLDKGKLDKVEALLTEVEAALGKAPPEHRDMPDRWEQAERLYRQHVVTLRNRRKLAPLVERLRASYAAAQEADRSRNRKDQEGGPAEAAKLAQACLAAFGEARTTGVPMDTSIELAKNTAPQRLDAATGECERVRRSTETLAKEQEKAARARRTAARRGLKGDRLKVFDAHPGALPEAQGSLATAAEWRYVTPSGTETITWKGNKRVGSAPRK